MLQVTEDFDFSFEGSVSFNLLALDLKVRSLLAFTGTKAQILTLQASRRSPQIFRWGC
jgi:hypothetical protein